MNPLIHFVARVVRGTIKLLLVALAFAMVMGILVIGLAVALLSIAWSLVRGRKPAAVTVFRRFHQTSQQFRASASAQSTDIVDVQAHEVRSALKKDD